MTNATANENVMQPVYRTYKDRVFRLLFKDKKRLLELYNALNHTSYTNEDDLTINTLENAIFMKMKNDVSFIIDCDMCLYEHQSTYCPNIPLRGFLYFADLFKIHIKDADLSVSRRITIPTPRYIVFYNGSERREEEFIQKLSDSFEGNKEGCIELTVRTININYGHNKDLMEKCKSLADYAYFIAKIRENLENMSLQASVEEAIESCIRQNILKDFLMEQKAEVIAMSIYEYNEEYVKKTLFEDGYDTGKLDGYNAGKADGYNAGKADGVLQVAFTLVNNIESAMKNLNIDLTKACEVLGVSITDYQNAKSKIKDK